MRQGWIRPAAKPTQAFSEADLARAALIRDLEDKLGFDEDQVPVLLNLIDQIHGLRAELKTLLDALTIAARGRAQRVKMRITKRKPADAADPSSVIAGLDPAIHSTSASRFGPERHGCPAQGRA